MYKYTHFVYIHMDMQVHTHADTSDSYSEQIMVADAVSVPQEQEGT